MNNNVMRVARKTEYENVVALVAVSVMPERNSLAEWWSFSSYFTASPDHLLGKK